MAWTPQLNVVCSRCGKPRGLAHTCFSSSTKKATAKPVLSFGKCEKCKRPVGNPLTHTCRPKSDFRQRRREHEKAEKADARKAAAKKRQQNAHDYQACSDKDCAKPLCVAFKRGYQLGDREGYDRGWQAGYDRGFPDGIAACPRSHQ